MLFGNGQAGTSIFGVVDAGLLSNAFDLISGSKFGIWRRYISKYLEIKMGHPVYQLANPSCVYTHAHNVLSTTAW